MKTILVFIDDDDGLEARLQAAFDLARAFAGHLMCLDVTPYAAYAIGDAAMGAYPLTALVEAVAEQRRKQRTTVEQRLQQEGSSWEWWSRDGDAIDRIGEASRLADVVVMSAGPFGNDAGQQLATTGGVVIHSPVPVIAVPPKARGFAVTGAALVAWDGSRESAVALRSALPLLRLAESVEILTVEEKLTDFQGREAAVWLSRYGVGVEVIERPSAGQSIEAVIREVIAERNAAFLVQGGYGHSRLRQTLFGGVTRGLLSDAPVPLVMAH